MSYTIQNRSGHEVTFEYTAGEASIKMTIPHDHDAQVDRLYFPDLGYRLHYSNQNRDAHSLEIFLDIDAENDLPLDIFHKRSNRHEGPVPYDPDMLSDTFRLNPADNVPIVIVGEIDIEGQD